MTASTNKSISAKRLENEIRAGKAAEERADIAELTYRTVFDSSNEAIAICDINTGNVIDCNDTLLKLYRASRETVLASQIEDIASGQPPYDKLTVLQWIKKTIEKGPQHFEWLAKRYDRSCFWCEVFLKKVSLGNKDCILVFIKDLTDWKKAEEEINANLKEKEALNQKIKESEERYRNLVENSVAGIGVSRKSRIVYANKALGELLGVETVEELYAKNLLDFATDKSKQEIYERMQRLKAGKPVPAEFEQEIVRKDGEIRTLSLQVSDIVFEGKECRQSTFIDITDKKRLEVSENRFKLMFEKAPYALALSDMSSGTLIDVNEVFCSKTRFKKAEIVGQSAPGLGFYSQEDRDRFIRLLKKNGTVEGLEMQVQAGSYIFYTRMFSRIIALNDKECILTAFEDITEIKETQNKLKLNEERLRLALSNAKEGIWDWDLKTDEVYFDEGYYTLAGYEPYEFPERYESWEDRVHPDDIAKSRKAITQCIQDNLPQYDVEFRFLRKDNSWMWIRAMGKVTAREDDGTPSRFTGTHLDITESKKTETALKESEERFSLFMKYIPATVFIKDMEGRVVFANERFADTINRKLEDLIGTISDESRSPELRDKFNKENTKVLKGETITSETSLPVKTGNEHYITYKFPLMKNSQPFYIGAISLNVTEQKELENRLIEAREQAEAANKAKTEFLSNISHELRTPMQGILGFAKLGIHRFNSLSEAKKLEYYEEIENSGSRLLRLLNNLLDLSRIESARAELVFKPDRLIDITDTVIKELQPMIQEKKLNLVFRKPEVNADIMLDRERIEQVIRNLTGNAIKFTAEFGRVEIVISRKDSEVMFAISDSGIGIPDQELESIFDPFVQSSKTKTGAGGTGLGLAICKKAIERHNGKIWAEHNPKGGATFKFRLPFEQ